MTWRDSARAWRVSALPVAVSLFLSAFTVGSRVHWQDSGIYLTAVREFSCLYPPGFVLYLVLCKGWTLLFGFLDFTLAAHLFSALCAALAAGVLARAALEYTKDEGASSVAAALAAAGYTWWFSGLYAKGYALLFLMVALLLWRMIRRDHRGVAVFSGLAWAAHPSAALLAPVVLIYIARHRSDLRALGAAKVAGLVAAGLLAAFGPSLLLPVLAGRDSLFAMGHPSTASEWFGYIAGSRFTSKTGVWGFTGWRWAHVGLYAWEEFLGVGLLLLGLGLVRIFREAREERVALIAWTVPVIAGATLFRIEGQFDFWIVSAWMPLWIAVAAGLSSLRTRYPHAPAGALVFGLAWAAAMNGRDLYLRGDDGPEALGRSMLQNLDPGATLVVASDDGLGLCSYLQTVRGFRTDVHVVPVGMLLPIPELQWYRDRLARHWPDWTPPDFSVVMAHTSKYTPLALIQAAVVQGRKAGAPPVFFDTQPPAELLGTGSIVPAGFLWKWSEQPAGPDPKYWQYPKTLEQAAARSGRVRGISDGGTDDPRQVVPQAYEERLVYYLAMARKSLGDLAQREGSRSGYERSARAYESILKAAPSFESDPGLWYPLGLDYYLLDRPGEAVAAFQKVVAGDPSAQMKAGALFYLGEIHLASRRPDEARSYYRQALAVVPDGSPLRAELEKRLK